jgi:hypothetical protein
MMPELRPHGRALLEAARRERTPSPAERDRLLSELLTAADPGPASGASTRHKLGPWGRLLVLVALALGIALLLYGASRAGRH